MTNNHISQSIAGIGLNLNQEAFLSSAPNPVSLWQITGNKYNPIKIAAHIMTRICAKYEEAQNNSLDCITQQYQDALFRRTGIHHYKDAQGDFYASFINVEENGRLILEDKKGCLRNYMFKEVEYIL